MRIKTSINYSPNFSTSARNKKNIKYIVYHYTGMRSENKAIKRLSKNQITSLIKLSKYLIKKYKIKASNILGHSDIAFERKKDPGEKFPWSYLANKKIGIWHKTKEQRLKKFRNKKISNIEVLKFINYLNKIGYLTKNLKNINKTKLIKSFQRRFRQKLINGKIDKEYLIIAEKMSKLIR